MTQQVEIDFETRSPVNLRDCGAHVYFEHPEALVLIGSYQIDGGAVGRWRLGEPCPLDLETAVINGATISAHNAAFEMLCFAWLHENALWPMPAYEQFRCTAATAAAMSLPRDLKTLGEVLDLQVQKDKDGYRLMRMFSIPDKNGGFKEAADHPAEFEAYHRYCDDDVLTEAAADAKLVPLSDDEQALWQLSERINRRGIRIDVQSARAAIRLADKAVADLNDEMALITDGAVRKVSEIGKLVAWCGANGVHLSGGAKNDIDEALTLVDLPPAVRTALSLRQEGAKTSVKKIEAMLSRASADGRVRGSFMYHGASTGRWTSMGVNFANMPRPRKAYEAAGLNTQTLFAAFRTEDPAFVRAAYGDDLGRPLHLISDAVRGFVWAAPGHDLVQADYSGIEGAVIAWLADETWKLAAMHDIIADPAIPDMYRQTAARILSLPLETVDKKHWARQAVGKVSELALGYQGGVSAFASMAALYHVDLDGLHGPVWEKADAEDRQKAERRHASVLKRSKEASDKMSRNAWLACEIIKRGWREQNSAISGSWREAEAAVRKAVETPGTITTALKCRFVVRIGYLWMQLPSGRCLAYASPRLSSQVWAKIRLDDGEWSDPEVMDREDAEKQERRGLCKIEGDTSPKVTFCSVDATTKKWRRSALYGGLIVQNATQAVARDILVNGMWKAEAAGYPVVAHVYDEIITEVPRGFGSVAEFERIICELPEWAAGLPLTAGGWRGKRYRKD